MKRRFVFIAATVPFFLASSLFAQDIFEYGRQTARTNGHPKAKGLDLKIDFPKSWLIEEGKRPNVVFKATSQEGKGLESCNVVIRDLEIDAGRKGYRPSQSELAYTLSANGLKEEAEASGMQFIKGAPSVLEGSPAGWFIAKQQGRAGIDVFIYLFVFQTFYDKWRIIITCGAGAASDAEAWNYYRKNDIGFRLITNSVVLVSKWR